FQVMAFLKLLYFFYQQGTPPRGMQLPGSSFVHPDSPLRDALTAAAARQVTRMTGNGNEWMPIGKMIDEKVVVNGIVALLATGGSTNHTMHLVAM
ncbi:dihydroxy-acid dehydratase, partial [Pseudomonas aeruginosa]|uniref:dihydroxy-acid dehydratase domain-containing protein n=1 Tax=Pseudomonas aeruginosa TaxID=287 RepID=UPI0031B6D42D